MSELRQRNPDRLCGCRKILKKKESMQNIRLIAHTKRDKPFCCGENCAACDEERRKGHYRRVGRGVYRRGKKNPRFRQRRTIPPAIKSGGRARSRGSGGYRKGRETLSLSAEKDYPACDSARRKGRSGGGAGVVSQREGNAPAFGREGLSRLRLCVEEGRSRGGAGVVAQRKTNAFAGGRENRSVCDYDGGRA